MPRDSQCIRCNLNTDTIQTPCLWGGNLSGRAEPTKLKSSVMVVRGAPNKVEDLTGDILRGDGIKAIIANICETIGAPIDAFYFTYLNKCATQTSTKKQREACSVFLEEEIAAEQPKVILAMGEAAAEYLCDVTALWKNRGIGVWNEELKLFCIPTFDFELLLKQPWKLSEITTDFLIAYNKATIRSIESSPSYFENNLSALMNALSTQKIDTIAFDIETDCDSRAAAKNGHALDPTKGKPWILTLSLLLKNNSMLHFLFDRESFKLGEWDQIGMQLATCDIPIVAQNGKFDLKFLLSHCIGWEDVILTRDTAITHHILNENSGHSLDALQWRYLPALAGSKNIETPNGLVKSSEAFENFPAHELDQDKLWDYAVKDTASTVLIDAQLRKALTPAQDALARMQARASTILAETETFGCNINEQLLIEMLIEHGTKARELEETLVSIAESKNIFEFNPSSPVQVGVLLYKKFKLPEYKDDDGKVSTDDDALLVLQNESSLPTGAKATLTYLREYRKHEKLRQTLQGIKERLVDDSGCRIIRTEYSMYYVVTGRLSSRNPNLQNIPKKGKVKNIFVPSEGYSFVEMDYSQAEYRVIAHMSQDEKMCAMLWEGMDFHAATMAELVKLGVQFDDDPEVARRQVKTFNFAELYGAGALKLAAMTGIPIAEVFRIQRMKKEAFPQLAAYIKAMPYIAINNGNEFVGFLGRVRRVPYANAKNKWWRSRAARQIVNSPVQGGASDLTMNAMVDVLNLPLYHTAKARVVLTVHDSIVWEVLDEHAEAFSHQVKYVAEHPELSAYGIDKLRVPLVADVKIKKVSWGEE